jgi:hypothetical protein
MKVLFINNASILLQELILFFISFFCFFFGVFMLGVNFGVFFLLVEERLCV